MPFHFPFLEQSLPCDSPSALQLLTADLPKIRASQSRQLALQAVTERRAVFTRFRKSSISAAVVHASRPRSPRTTLPPPPNTHRALLPRPSRFCRAHPHVEKRPRIMAAKPTRRRRRASPIGRPRPRHRNAKIATWPIRNFQIFLALPLPSRY